MSQSGLSCDELLSSTRAVRKRLDFSTPVPDDLVRECVSLALQAPSGSNEVTMRFIVVRDPTAIAAIADVYAQCWKIYETFPMFAGAIKRDTDEHQAQQDELIDQIAERIMQLGGVSIAMGVDAAEESEIPRPPRDRETPMAQLARLAVAHEIVLSFARQAGRRASEGGDDGTNDLIVSNCIRLNEKQAWFITEHLSHIKPD